MSIVIATHKVRDYDEWRPYFDADMERRSGAGIKHEKVYRSSNDLNEIHIMWELDNPSVIEQMMSDPDLKEKMQEAGVISEPTYVVLNET